MQPIQEVAFPTLSKGEFDLVKTLATACDYADGEIVFRAGEAEVDLYIVESGQIEIRNPTDGDRVIVTHEPGQFSGDIDLLTGRPVIVTGVAKGKTRAWRVAHSNLRSILNRVPTLGEKLIVAFTRRRELLAASGVSGLRVIGAGRCRDTNTVREFLYKNFVPFRWLDTETDEGQAAFKAVGSPLKTPVIECGNGRVLANPSLRELAHEAGIWKHCPSREVDFAIVGAGPAGIAAAVYAASEGLSTLMLDRLGPGGQAGGSSRIENFMGFPAGLSGADLATRGILQMLKFGAQIVTPVVVEKLTPAKTVGDFHLLHLDCGAEIRCRVVLLALGVLWRRLEAAGADRFAGAGIYYACTTVEADLYDGTDVAVVGAGNSAGQAVMFLSECCPSRKVHLLIRRTLGPGMSEYLSSRIKSAGNVVIHEQTEIESVAGDRRPERITLKNNATGQQREIPCSALFIFIGATPAADWLPPEIARDTNGYLLTGTDVVRSGRWPCADRDPCPLETTIPGVLAAGDIRAGSTKRVGFAVGDGSLAVTCAHRLLSITR
ncbi:MAG TPA: FAD-dependent oxidoreductase [Lacipirellulaceae bacterium]|jgi:thioredoxin reductase (NADPH)|nr:FAD-dependent oxidoreductase [Lacipirellulaceae bacterium]